MNVSLPSMLKLLQRIVEINNTGGTGRILLTLSMRAFGPRISAYAFWTTTDIHTDIIIYIFTRKMVPIMGRASS